MSVPVTFSNLINHTEAFHLLEQIIKEINIYNKYFDTNYCLCFSFHNDKIVYVKIEDPDEEIYFTSKYEDGNFINGLEILLDKLRSENKAKYNSTRRELLMESARRFIESSDDKDLEELKQFLFKK